MIGKCGLLPRSVTKKSLKDLELVIFLSINANTLLLRQAQHFFIGTTRDNYSGMMEVTARTE